MSSSGRLRIDPPKKNGPEKISDPMFGDRFVFSDLTMSDPLSGTTNLRPQRCKFQIWPMSQQVESPNRKCQGLSCGIQFFLFHWGSEMVFCIISCWKNGSTSKYDQPRPSVASLCLVCELYMVFLAYFEMMSNWMVCESWNTSLFVNVFLSQQVESPNRKCQGLSCGIQFFLFHWGSEMVFCIISCWKHGSTSK